MRKFFNLLTWIQIVFFGWFIGSGIGIVIYLKSYSSAYLITAIIFSACGLAFGIYRAERVRKSTPKGGYFAHTLFSSHRRTED